jgi:hypothetical protein
LVGCVLFPLLCWSFVPGPKSNGKKVVNRDNNLPRFVSPVKGSAPALPEADDASFNVFAAKVRTQSRAKMDGVI